MTVAFVAPRFHTNQFHLIKELLQREISVRFFAFESKHSENHELFQPEVVGYAWFTKTTSHSRQLKYGLPSFQCIRSVLGANADVTILRAFSKSTFILSIILRLAGRKVVIYTQEPIHSDAPSLLRLWFKRLCGKFVMTPVWGDATKPHRDVMMLGQKWEYVPFVIHPNPKATGRKYFKDGKINILVIGKYTARKNIIEFLNTYKKVSSEIPGLSLTITGTILEQEVYEKALALASEMESVKLLRDIPHTEMENLYLDADLFVLPAVQEPASISQLEAMANGLAVICSDDNGTASYVKPGINGEIFHVQNYDVELYQKLMKLLTDRNLIRSMGMQSLELVKNYHNVDLYMKFLQSHADGRA